MPNWTSNNAVVTLVDGEAIFRRLQADLAAVDELGFIYLAFWQFSPNLVLDVSQPTNTLGNLLRQQARRGAQICILMWDYFTSIMRAVAQVGTATLPRMTTAETLPGAGRSPALIIFGGRAAVRTALATLCKRYTALGECGQS